MLHSITKFNPAAIYFLLCEPKLFVTILILNRNKQYFVL